MNIKYNLEELEELKVKCDSAKDKVEELKEDIKSLADHISGERTPKILDRRISKWRISTITSRIEYDRRKFVSTFSR